MDILTSGSAVKDHGGPKKGRQLHVKRTISYLLWFPGCPSVLEPIRLQHRHCRICRHQIQLKSEVSGLAPRNSPRTTQNTSKQNKRGTTIEMRMDVCEIFLNSWRSSQIMLTSQKTENCEVCLRTKMTRAPCRRRTGEAVPRAETFCDLITG